MKLISTLGLVVASLAVMALIGAGSASATVFCKENASPCPESKVYPMGTPIEGELETGKVVTFTTDTKNVECEASEFTGKTLQDTGEPLGVEFSELNFTFCETTAVPPVPCTVIALDKPHHLGAQAVGAGNGAFALHSSKGAMSLEVNCGAPLNCIFSTPQAVGEIGGGSPATASASTGNMQIVKGISCPKKLAELNTGTYEVTTPAELFVISEIAPPVLCKSNTDPCPAGETLGINTALKGELEAEMKFTFTVGEKAKEPVCKTSKFEGKTTEAGTPLLGEISSLTTKECSGACTVTALRTPYRFEIEHVGGGNGSMTWSNLTKGQPAFEIICGLETCVYGAAGLPFTLTGGTPAKLSETEIVLSKELFSGVFCSATATWEGVAGAGALKYKFTSPGTFFVRS